MDVQVLSFQKPKQLIRGFPLEKRRHFKVIELPVGSQILSAEDQSHEGNLMLWVMLPAAKGVALERRTLLVTYEGEEFEISEEEIPGMNSVIPNVYHIGMWVDRVMDDGDLISVTGHVLEVLGDDD